MKGIGLLAEVCHPRGNSEVGAEMPVISREHRSEPPVLCSGGSKGREVVQVGEHADRLICPHHFRELKKYKPPERLVNRKHKDWRQ
jgi:hypothetical protein